MVRTTFERILKHFTAKKFNINKVSKNIIERVLDLNGYKIYNDTNRINAYKHVGNDRFHIEIELFPDNEVHKESELRIHKDIGYGLFHETEYGKDEVSFEYTTIVREILNELKKEAVDGLETK